MSRAPVSVVIPAYNCRSTIASTLASVFAQTALPSEVIVVDDGSTDGTWEFLHQLKVDSYPDLSLLSHEGRRNYGASMARTLGVSRSSCEYIAFLDSDDQFHPEKLERQLNAFMVFPDIVLCHTGVEVIGDLGQAEYFRAAFSGSPTKPYCFRRLPDYLVRDRICNSSVLFRVSAYRAIHPSFVSKTGIEDWLTWCLLAAQGPFLFLAEPLTLYCVHDASITAALVGSDCASSVASALASKLRRRYAAIEFKLVLLARSESSLHAIRVFASILEDLRCLIVAYLWDPGCDPNSTATVPVNGFVRLLMLPSKALRLLRIAR